MLMSFKQIILSFLFALLVNCSFKTATSIYAGTFAFCSSTCVDQTNQACSGRCISFRDNVGGKNIRNQRFLAEVCWQIHSCAEFPKFFSFQTDKECAGQCEVNVFAGFSKTQLNQNIDLYNTKGYNMMCIEEASSESPFPNICQLAAPYAVQRSEGFYQHSLKIIAVFLIMLMSL